MANPIPCAQCGRSFLPDKSHSRYCSMRCFGDAQMRRVDVTCQQCGIVFAVHPRTVARGAGKFCSRPCRYEWMRTPPNKECQVCGAPIAQRPHDRWEVKYCSWACRKAGMRGESHPAWKGGNHSYRGDQWDTIRERILERDRRACQHCGNMDDLTVHHIQPWAETRDNSPSNLITLCRSCHSRVHYPDKLAR